MKMKIRQTLLFLFALTIVVAAFTLVACDNTGTAKLNAQFDVNHKIYVDDSLDSLKQYLTVTLVDQDGTVTPVTDYELEGTLQVGFVTLTVKYLELTTTFQIAVENKETSSDTTEELGFALIGNGDAYCVSDVGTAVCKEITIPSTYDGKPVTTIGLYAFSDCEQLTSVTIPESVTAIEIGAFRRCRNLSSITIPKNIASISNSAFAECSGLQTVYWNATDCEYAGRCLYDDSGAIFKGCTQLTTLEIGENVTTLPDYAFYKCNSLKYATITDSVKKIGSYTFYACGNLSGITIPDAVTEIGEYAFFNCSGLTVAEIGDGVTQIGASAFDGCSSLTELTIPEGVTSIGIGAFSLCTGLESITIGSDVEILDGSAFYGCSSLSNVILPDNVTEIGIAAFFNCNGLTSVTIGGGTATIGEMAFSGCINLAEIRFNGTIAQWNAIDKGDEWQTDVPSTQVICKDGAVDFDGQSLS